MKKFKSERDWSDLERADKIVLLSGVLLWVILSAGVFYNDVRHSQQKQIVNSTMIRHR